ncbi:MAG: DUF2318 domain-containing protein [Proteobacteria bacterium]|nr:DUF2318 domain-containing protein [Pseudomonadota bacterium]MBU4463532.1 DUF2318 domain-containing protein [Pseudomonadota bacterium]
MKRNLAISTAIFIITLALASGSFAFWGQKIKTLTPAKGLIKIPVASINDGKAHYYRVKAEDGIIVTFFVLKSSDGIVRAAIDACNVCYRSGKGYIQEGDFMVCENCGMKFASNRINEVKGGCNPAPLKRRIDNSNLVIEMKDINANSWYCKYKK